MPAFGLDVGSSSIKLIELAGDKKKPKLNAFGLAVNPVGNLDTENEAEKVQIAQAIKKLVADSGVKEKKAVVALPETKVFTRVIDIPVLSDSELASAINWEAEQYIPVPISEVQLDYRVLSRPQGGGVGAKMRVFLVAAPLNVVNKLVRLLELAGIEIVALETEVLGLARSLVTAGSATVMIIELGLGSTDLCILEGEMILFTRSLSTGGNALSRVLATDLGLKPSQAEQYKRAYGLDGSQLQGKVRKSLAPVFTSIVGEVRKAIHFYSSSRKGKIGRVVLAGGGAYLPEITSELARELGMEVVVANPFVRVSIDGAQQKRIGGIGAVFSVAVGLAMREL